jgi:hypothetical protein
MLPTLPLRLFIMRLHSVPDFLLAEPLNRYSTLVSRFLSELAVTFKGGAQMLQERNFGNKLVMLLKIKKGFTRNPQIFYLITFLRKKEALSSLTDTNLVHFLNNFI